MSRMSRCVWFRNPPGCRIVFCQPLCHLASLRCQHPPRSVSPYGDRGERDALTPAITSSPTNGREAHAMGVAVSAEPADEPDRAEWSHYSQLEEWMHSE